MNLSRYKHGQRHVYQEPITATLAAWGGAGAGAGAAAAGAGAAAAAGTAAAATSFWTIPTILTAVGAGAQVIGLLSGGQQAVNNSVVQDQQAQIQNEQALMAADQSDYQAAQLDQNAGQQRAASQRQAAEQRRQARLAASRVQALAGGGSTDPSVLGLTGDIAGEGEYNALSALYEGEEKARGMEMQATSARGQGDQYRKSGQAALARGQVALQQGQVSNSAAKLNATSALFSGASSLFTKYGDGGYKNAPVKTD